MSMLWPPASAQAGVKYKGAVGEKLHSLRLVSSVEKGKILKCGLEQGIPKNTLLLVLRYVQEHSLLSLSQTAVTGLRTVSVIQKSVVLQEEAGSLETLLESCHKTICVYF